MKNISILGSTGSIGTSTLSVIRHLPERLRVTALAANSNIDLLESQAREFSPEIIAVYDKEKARELQRRLPGMKVLGGLEGLLAVATHSSVDMVISAMTGTVGLKPTLEAISAGKDIALANKEVLVAGGELVMRRVKEKGVSLIPVDSEHSALFQCLNGENRAAIRRLILTASGGPFRTWSNDQLQKITVDEALNHPTWRMGPKVTIDCSTLMNKGLEVIEAYWLFGVPVNQISVLVHPQSTIHSMVEFVDNSLIAQLGRTDMKIPIQYAMTYPDRLPGLFEPFDFTKNGTLQFFEPDYNRFRCLSLAFQALETGGTLACYMNAANEVLVQRFLERQFGWTEIATKLESLMSKHDIQKMTSVEDIYAVDAQARGEAAKA